MLELGRLEVLSFAALSSSEDSSISTLAAETLNPTSIGYSL